jgi:hypothetical protein
VAQTAENLLCELKDLSSNPGHTKNKTKIKLSPPPKDFAFYYSILFNCFFVVVKVGRWSRGTRLIDSFATAVNQAKIFPYLGQREVLPLHAFGIPALCDAC